MAVFNQYADSSVSDSQAAGVRQGVSKRFPSPWLDPASTEMPVDLEQVFRFCELLWYSNGVYQQAMNRIAAYFVTKVKITGVSQQEHDQWKDFLENDFHVNKAMVDYGRNFLAYGNVMMSPRLVVNRLLRCGNCGQTAPLTGWKFRFKDLKFSTLKPCPSCHKGGELQRMDFRSFDKRSLSVRIWNPHQMKVKYNELTDRSIYHYVLQDKIRKSLREGDPDFLQDTPWEFVQCAVKNKPLRIYQENIFHCRDNPLAGVDTDGMGLPRAMANFRQAYLSQAYKRLNMVLAIDYSTPMRSVTPEPSGMLAMDPTMGLDMGDINGKLMGLLSDWKRDPAAMNVFPIPLRYTAWGGEGLQMASYQLQDQAMSELLTGLGIPVDFFVGTFKSERTFVPTLRLLERTWEELVASYNAILAWLADMLSRLLRWTKPTLVMEPTTIANDIEFRNIMLELWMNNRISGRRALEPMNIDPVEENEEMLQEQLEMQQQADLAALQQQEGTDGMQSMLGGPGAGQAPEQGGAQLPSAGAPTGAMQNTPTRPEDILAQAKQIAEQLLSMPEGERHQPLSQLRNDNELLHAAVVRQMDQMRSQIGSEAAAQGSQGAQ